MQHLAVTASFEKESPMDEILAKALMQTLKRR